MGWMSSVWPCGVAVSPSYSLLLTICQQLRWNLKLWLKLQSIYFVVFRLWTTVTEISEFKKWYRMAIIYKNTNKCWWGYGEKRTLCTLLMGMWIGELLWKTIWRVLKKLKLELSYDLAIPLLSIYLKKMKTLMWKDTYIPMFIATLFTIAKIWK